MAINRVVLTGRITKDLDLRKTASGMSILKFTLAVDKQGKDKESNFIPCVIWAQGADYLQRYAHKGTTLAVDGHIETRTYEDKDGKTQFVMEVIIDHSDIVKQPQNTRGNDYEVMNGERFNTGESLDLTSDQLPF